jgi:hypothetical protein
MAYAYAARQVVQIACGVNFVDLALILLQIQRTIKERGFTHRVVASIFKPFQASMNHWRSIAVSHNTAEYTAHTSSIILWRLVLQTLHKQLWR